MSLDTALFLVDRGGTNYKVSGADIRDKIQNGDQVLVQRGTERFRTSYDNEWKKIKNDDLLIAWDGSTNRSVTGENFKNLFKQQIINLGQLGGAINPSLQSPFPKNTYVYFGVNMTYSDTDAFTYDWTFPPFLEAITPPNTSTVKTQAKRAGVGIVRCDVRPAPGYTGYPIPLTLSKEVSCSG